MSSWEREEWESGPPEDKSERLQGIRHLNEPELCGYSNCYRPFYKMRGFMPCCELHYKNPQKWGKDGKTFTGSIFRLSPSKQKTEEDRL
jgi:hypothetical protein